jgi:hypothetical protein
VKSRREPCRLKSRLFVAVAAAVERGGNKFQVELSFEVDVMGAVPGYESLVVLANSLHRLPHLRTMYLAWLPVVVLMIVKESSDLALQLSCVVRLGHRNSVVKEPVLNISW